jgi:hypothetical protein
MERPLLFHCRFKCFFNYTLWVKSNSFKNCKF